MAGKPLNRLELRRQSDAAEPLDPMEDESEELVEDVDDDDAQDKKPKKKPKAPSKAKAKTVKVPKPAARMRIVWTVMNDAFKPIATFEYAQKEAAETKAAEMTAKGKGTHFVMKSKEPMPDNAPGLGAVIPRNEPPPPPPPAAKKEQVVEDDEEAEDDEEEEEAEPEEEPEEE